MGKAASIRTVGRERAAMRGPGKTWTWKTGRLRWVWYQSEGPMSVQSNTAPEKRIIVVHSLREAAAFAEGYAMAVGADIG